MYVKVYKSMWDGSLRGKPDLILVFLNLFSHCDQKGFVDRHFKAIIDETGLSMLRVKAAVLELESPDELSRSPELEGRRIERIDSHRDWGWRVVNYAYYRGLINSSVRMEQNRIRQQRFRDKKKAETVTPLPVAPRNVTSTHVEVEVEVDEEGGGSDAQARETPPQESVVNHPNHNQAQNHFKGQYGFAVIKMAFLSFEANADEEGNWKWGRGPVTDWRAALESRINDQLDKKPGATAASEKTLLEKELDSIE